MKAMARARLLLTIVSAALLLSGCVTPVQVVSSRPPSERAPAADEGVLALSVTVNTGTVGQFDTLILKREGDPDPKKAGAQYEYSVPEITGRASRDTALFLATLKQGNYTIVRMYDSDALTTFTPNANNTMLGSFKIEAGKLTDLGRLVVTPINFDVAVGRSRLITNNEALLSRFAPSTHRFYSEVLPGWNTPRQERDVIETFALSHPVGVTNMVELEDGRVAAATRLGTILLREPSGEWRSLRNGTLDAWLSVAPGSGPDTMLVAVGEYNNIARVDAQGTFHAVDTSGLPVGTLTFVAGNTTHGWVVAHKVNDKFTLYRTDSLDQPQWNVIHTDTLAFSFWSGAQQLWLWPTKNGFGYGRSTGEIRLYDLASRQWTERTSPEKKTIITLAPSPGDALGILTSPGGGFGGVTASAWLSKDGAQTWQETGTPYKVKVYPPKLTASGLMLQSGGVFGKDTLQGSKDLGKTWAPLSEKVALNDLVIPMPSRGLFKLANAGFGTGNRNFEIIAHSSDDGVTWKVEYSSLDYQLMKMQLEKSQAPSAKSGKDAGKK